MILKLHDSKMFTVDTARRFAKEYNVKQSLWNEIFKRSNMGYDSECLAGFFIYRTGKKISAKTIRKWLLKTEVYCRANHVMRMGVRVVQSEYFGVYEDFVLEEVLRNMKFRGTKESRTLV